MATRTRLTADDLWRMGDSDVRRELGDGEVIEQPLAGGIHGYVVAQLCGWLGSYVDAHRRGSGVVGVGFVLGLPSDPERVRAPDLAFVSMEKLPEGFIHGAPDLAVEVLSPSDNPVDVQQKVRDYLEAGSRLVWVLAPLARSATIYRPDGSTRLVREPESLDGEDVVPGLAIPLADVLE
jgi:Uma2 family endonuclease